LKCALNAYLYFLASNFRVTSAAGTRRLAAALRNAAKKSDLVAEFHAIDQRADAFRYATNLKGDPSIISRPKPLNNPQFFRAGMYEPSELITVQRPAADK
jgi:hypothetical protein